MPVGRHGRLSPASGSGLRSLTHGAKPATLSSDVISGCSCRHFIRFGRSVKPNTEQSARRAGAFHPFLQCWRLENDTASRYRDASNWQMRADVRNRCSPLRRGRPASRPLGTDGLKLGNRLTVDPRTLTPLVLVRIQVPQPRFYK